MKEKKIEKLKSKIKITWIEEEIECTNMKYWSANVRDKHFLDLVEERDGEYYIHTSWFFRVQGNEGLKEWGNFYDLDECKEKAESLIREELLSFFEL